MRVRIRDLDCTVCKIITESDFSVCMFVVGDTFGVKVLGRVVKQIASAALIDETNIECRFRWYSK
jgi:hypothetical protein